MNYKVSQQYPGSKNNTITLKLIVKNKVEGSLKGDWSVVKNGKVLQSSKVETSDDFYKITGVYHNLAESLELTEICSIDFDLSKY